MKRAITAACLLAIGLMGMATQGLAQTAAPAADEGLPADAQAQAWLEQSPPVRRAQALLDAARQGARAQAAGPHEWTLKATTQQRRYQEGGVSREWSLGLERSLRWWGKAELDRRLGEQGQRLAQALLGEARHEAARQLAELWLGLLAAREGLALAESQQALALQQREAVARRHRAGDAARLDLDWAEAELAEAQRLQREAATRLAQAGIQLQRFTPELPAAASVPAPALLQAPGGVDWVAHMVEESDALLSARLQSEQAELHARRQAAERRPDPTVGLYTASEASRSERLVGLSLSLPLGGAQREARLGQALAEAEASRAELAQVRAEVEAEARALLARWEGGVEAWSRAKAQREAATQASRRVQRGYELGELDLTALVQSRRLQAEAERAELQARLEAQQARTRLLVDAHQIWGLAHD